MFQGISKSSIVGMMVLMVGMSAQAGASESSTEATGVVLACSSGKVSSQDRVNVTLTRGANGKITAEVESLKGQRGQAMVARRGVSEKRGPAGASSYKSESGDFQMKVEGGKSAQVTFRKGHSDVKAHVSCQSGGGLFEKI